MGKKATGLATQKKFVELKANSNNLVLLNGYTDAEVKVIENFQYIRIKKDIDVSDLRIPVVYNDTKVRKRIIINHSDGRSWKFIDNAPNYYSDNDIELYYNWDNHTSNVNVPHGFIGILESAKNISTNNSIVNIKEHIGEINSNITEINSNITEYKTEKIQYDEIIKAHPNGTSGTFVTGTMVYDNTAIFSVQKDEDYIISGKTVGPTDVPYCSIMFTTDKEQLHGTSLLNTDPKNIGAEISLKFKPTSNGYLFVWSYSNKVPPYIVGKITESISLPKENKKNIDALNAFIDNSFPMRDKSLAILGDSIMMLMRTNHVSSNTITYQDDEKAIYDYSLLTNINGHLYVTSTLQDGEITETSKMVNIINSSQADYDFQNWEALKQDLGVQNLYNFGLGGAMFNEREVITSYPYPDGNGHTTDLPNEVRWLIRRYKEDTIKYPDCIVIWMGTNYAGQPTSDNYDEIMALTYNELNSDEHYRNRKTLYGGLRWSLETLYRNFKLATIILVTPVQTNLSNYRTYDKLTITANAIKKMARRYSCMVFDALNEIGVVDFFESADGSGYFLGDGLHPNAAGKILWKNYLAQKLKSSFFAK